MCRLSTTLALIVAIYSCIEVSADASKTIARRLSTLQRESLVTANAIRNMTITDQQHKVQIVAMANDFIASLDYGKYLLNNVIPHCVTAEEHKYLAYGAQFLSIIANNIQQIVSGDINQLKEALASSLEEIYQSTTRANISKISLNNIATIQVTKKIDLIIYGITKLKYQAVLFDKPNKQLGPEIRKTVTDLKTTLNTLSFSDENINEFHNLLEHASIVTAKNSYKLQNWAEFNSNSTKDVRLVQKVALLVSALFDQEIQTISSNIPYMKTGVLDIYEAALEPSIELTHIQNAHSPGGTEFLRSFFFDMIAAGRFYCENLRNAVTVA